MVDASHKNSKSDEPACLLVCSSEAAGAGNLNPPAAAWHLSIGPGPTREHEHDDSSTQYACAACSPYCPIWTPSGACVASQADGICDDPDGPSSASTDDRVSSLRMASSGVTW